MGTRSAPPREDGFPPAPTRGQVLRSIDGAVVFVGLFVRMTHRVAMDQVSQGMALRETRCAGQGVAFQAGLVTCGSRPGAI